MSVMPTLATVVGAPALNALKLAQLKQAAFLTGSHSATNKARLIESIAQGVLTPRVRGRSGAARILSIDMGIRNLAYCVLEVPRPAELFTSAAPVTTLPQLLSSASVPSKAPPTLLNHVCVRAWQRTSLLMPSLSADSGAASVSTLVSNSDAGPELASGLGTGAGTGAGPGPIPEKFDPPSLAPLAYTFLSTLLDTYAPTHVLIERQRHRSNGMAAVQEWTMRVNSLEAMFFAILHTLSAQSAAGLRPWSVESITSVDPKRVAAFWTTVQSAAGSAPAFGSGSESGSEPTRTSSRTKAKAGPKTLKGDEKKMSKASGKGRKIEKESRIALVASFLASTGTGSGPSLAFKGAAAETTRAQFLAERARKSLASSSRSTPRSHRAKAGITATATATAGAEAAAGAMPGSGPGTTGPNASPSPSQEQGPKKLDDLSDCLLQALAVLQWDLNGWHTLRCLFPAASIPTPPPTPASTSDSDSSSSSNSDTSSAQTKLKI